MALHLNQQEIGYPYWFYVWKNYSELRGMLHFWVDSETKHFGYCTCLGHAPHVEKKTFCSSHWYLEDKKGWGGLQLHDYDELSMNYCNCMILYEQFVDHSDNEPWKTMFSPSLHAFFWDSHHQYKSWWSGHTWNGLYSTVVCCCLPKRPSLAVEPLHLSKWKRSKMKLEKQGRNPWPSFHIPAQNEILGPGLSKASLLC